MKLNKCCCRLLWATFCHDLKSIYIRRDGTGSQSRHGGEAEGWGRLGGGFLTFVGRSQQHHEAVVTL